jgi:hypothetical protein
MWLGFWAAALTLAAGVGLSAIALCLAEETERDSPRTGDGGF